MAEERLVIIAPPLVLSATSGIGGGSDGCDPADRGELPAERDTGHDDVDRDECAGATDVPASDVERADGDDSGDSDQRVGLYGRVDPVQLGVGWGDGWSYVGAGGDLVDERGGVGVDGDGG
jgi:hypothetical protein